MAGWLMNDIRDKNNATLLPVDSEHSAIFQCLMGENFKNINRIILTGSGGPFRERKLETFNDITLKEALRHPNWSMGKKITIDSATMMNKGLEFIEAYWLFGIEKSRIDIVVHPQSIIHSMVEFSDGSIKAQMGEPDMKVPIQFSLSYPERYVDTIKPFNFVGNNSLTFEDVDIEKFPCIQIAKDAIKVNAKVLWGQIGVRNDEAARIAEEAGIKVVMDRCPKIELFRPFWKPKLNLSI